MNTFGKIIFVFAISVSFSFISCVPVPEWNGTVRYEVTGNTSDVSIIYNGTNQYYTINSIPLSWVSGNISAHAEDEISFSCYVKIINNTDETEMITAKIYVNNVLVTEKSGSGAHCEVVAWYDIDNTY
jgi:hypothetical protein